MGCIVQSFWYSVDIKKNSISVISDISMQYLIKKVCEGGGDIERLKIIDANEIIDKQKIFLDDRGAVGIVAFGDYFSLRTADIELQTVFGVHGAAKNKCNSLLSMF